MRGFRGLGGLEQRKRIVKGSGGLGAALLGGGLVLCFFDGEEGSFIKEVEACDHAVFFFV